MKSKNFACIGILVTLFVCLVVYTPAACAVVIEPDPDLQDVIGDLYSLSVVMRLYYDDTHKILCPGLPELAHYLKQPFSDGWPADYRTTVIQGSWWVGRKVPEVSTARRFLREHASSFGLYDLETQSLWMGGAFVWVKSLSFDGKNKPEPDQKTIFSVAQGDGKDSQHLFFNLNGTDRYWRSKLIYTTEAHSAALKKFGTDAKGHFVMPPPPSKARETISASPATPPPDFTLGIDEELETDMKIGDISINPISRPRD